MVYETYSLVYFRVKKSGTLNLIFELMDMNLFEYIKNNYVKGLKKVSIKSHNPGIAN